MSKDEVNEFDYQEHLRKTEPNRGEKSGLKEREERFKEKLKPAEKKKGGSEVVGWY